MSTAYSSAKQKYIGNGSTTEWGFDFPIQKHSELKVYLKRSGLPQVLLEEGVDYSFVTENTIAFPIKTGEAKLQAADVLAMQRESVFESEYNFSNQQRLEPEEVMHADDNLERQIQELKRDSESSIKVLPTSSVDPTTLVEHVERVYGSVDNIDTVANDKANVDKVAGSISNVNTVASMATSVTTVANNNANITKVGTNISAVNTAATNIAAIKNAPTAASNASQSATNAANSATASANSATASANSANASAKSKNDSHIWAEGTDAQVQALGGVHSSKVWAEQSTNANIALTNSPYTTNRILEIPQDIKLELNNGTLTLKAGSKLYIPNGFEADGTTPKFDVIAIDNNITTQATVNGTNFIRYQSGVLFADWNIMDFSSGTDPTGVTGWFYDTTANYIGYYNNGTRTNQISFPIGIAKVSGGVITSIDQVFNGFGYIGSTVFALPGVKVQIPNGRNKDGTYRVIPYTTQNVIVKEVTGTGVKDVLIYSNGVLSWADGGVYLAEDGYVRNKTNGTIRYGAVTGQVFITTAGKIDSFVPRTVDSVANSNASNFSQAGRSYLSGLGMPSGRYIDLTLGASGSTYTAPANGWFAVSGKSTANGGYCFLDTNNYEPSYMTTNTNGWYDRGFIPVRKGQVMTLRYGNYEIEADKFKFIYAEGDQ